MKPMSIKKIFFLISTFFLVCILTGCELFLYSKPTQYHICAQLSFSEYYFSIDEMMFYRGYRACYDCYMKNDDKVEKIEFKENNENIFASYMRDCAVYYNDCFYILDSYSYIEEKTFLSVRDNKFNLTKQVSVPFIIEDRSSYCFTKNGNYYFLNCNDKEKEIYDLYRFNIWNEELELLHENVEKNKIIVDGDEVVLVNSYYKIFNLSYKKEYEYDADGIPHSFLINSKIYDFVDRCNWESKYATISVCCEEVTKASINLDFLYFKCRVKLINDDIYFVVQNLESNDNCIDIEAGYYCICELGASTIYKYDTAKGRLEVIRSFPPETFIIDFNDENIKYYYDGALYNNDDKICDFKLNYDKNNLTTISEFKPRLWYYDTPYNEGAEYWKFVGSKIKFLMIGDEIYYYDGLYNKYTVLEV